MTLNCTQLFKSAALMAMLATHGMAWSQGIAPTYEGFLSYIEEKCPNMVRDALSNPTLAPVFFNHAVDLKKACACVSRKFQEDKRLREYLNTDAVTQANRIRTKNFQTYGSVRTYQSLLTCIEPELNAALSAAPLE